MSDDVLQVLIAETPAGTLRRHRDNRLEFVYDDAYLAMPAPTPLSTTMPTASQVHTGQRLNAWLWGLLPDNDTVLERWARRFQVSLGSPFGLLSSPVGADCAGAVRFLTPGASTGPPEVRWLDDDEIATRIAELRRDATSWLGATFTGRFSLAGAQAKTALHYDDGRWGEALGSAPTTHILKPAVAGLDDHDLNEHLCLTVARRVGLQAANTSVTTFAGEQCIVVERFDRRRTADGWQRVHQEDICQALGIHPSAKYQSDGGPGPVEIAALMRRLLPGAAAIAAVRALADALVFNWIIAGTDAHAKNYSLLLSGGEVRVAPLYDVASALPYADHVRKLRLAMKMGDDYRLYAQRPSTWAKLAGQLGFDADELVERVRALAVAIPAAFNAAARELDEQLDGASSLPLRLSNAVAQRVDTCTTALP